jgi:hypothetical protein
MLGWRNLQMVLSMSTLLGGLLNPRHKVFISYHHKNDQWAKQELLLLNRVHDLFIDGSVDVGDFGENLSDEYIRQSIRDDYLRDSTVTIVLVGRETKFRKHIDWEIYSSMFNGRINKQSGVLVIELPGISQDLAHIPNFEIKRQLLSNFGLLGLTGINTRASIETRHPYMPDRLIDNLLKPKGRLTVVPWSKVENQPQNLKRLIETAYCNRLGAEYDLSRPLRRYDYDPGNNLGRMLQAFYPND